MANWRGLVEATREALDEEFRSHNRLMAAMLTGEEITVFGQRARIRLEWPDGCWLTDDQLREYGERMKAANAAH